MSVITSHYTFSSTPPEPGARKLVPKFYSVTCALIVYTVNDEGYFQLKVQVLDLLFAFVFFSIYVSLTWRFA